MTYHLRCIAAMFGLTPNAWYIRMQRPFTNASTGPVLGRCCQHRPSADPGQCAYRGVSLLNNTYTCVRFLCMRLGDQLLQLNIPDVSLLSVSSRRRQGISVRRQSERDLRGLRVLCTQSLQGQKVDPTRPESRSC